VVWDPGKQAFVHTTFKGKEPIKAAAWSTDGKLLAVGHQDGSVELQDRAEAMKPHDAVMSTSVLRWPHSDLPVRHLVFSPDGKTLASLGGDERQGKLVLWNLGTLPAGTAKMVLTRWTKSTHLVFTPDSSTLIQVLGSSEVILWDVASGRPKPLQLPAGCLCLSVSADGTTLCLLRPETSDLIVWDVATNQESHSMRMSATGKVDLSAAVSPKARHVAVEVRQKDRVGVFLIDVSAKTWTRLGGPGWSDWRCAVLMFSPDGAVLAKVGERVKLYVELNCASTDIDRPLASLDLTVGND
jgi:WD40 repeat protein